MYGMVNVAMQQLVVAQHGEATWQRIKARAGCSVDVFIRMQPYDDALTFDLVGAAVAELSVPADELLKTFGRWWVQWARQNGYTDFFTSCSSYEQFLSALDGMHHRVQMTMPELRAPQFTCERLEAQRLRVIYRSHREGLRAFVWGLLEGLGEVFSTPVGVTHERAVPRSSGSEEHFLITLG